MRNWLGKTLAEVLAPTSTATPDLAPKGPSWSAERFSYGAAPASSTRPAFARGPVVRLPADRTSWRRHAVAMVPLLIAAVWIMRQFLLSSGIPAGSDMFGFVARARENSSWAHMVSVWAPSYYGAPRQFTLDLVLGLVNHFTGNPVATVKLLAFATLFVMNLCGWGRVRSGGPTYFVEPPETTPTPTVEMTERELTPVR